MAGVDRTSRGDAAPADGHHASAFCRRSRGSTRRRTCASTSRRRSRRRAALLTRFEELSTRLGETAPTTRWRSPRRAGDACRTRSTPPTPGSSTATLEIAMDALRLPPGDADVSHALRRRAPPRGALPAPPPAARPAAARRADQPPRRRVGRLARAPPAGVPGHGRRGHPRPLLPRQRRRLDPRARPRLRHPVGGQLLVLARAEGEAARAGGEGGVGPPARARARAGMGAHRAPRAAGEEQGAPRALRGAARRGAGGRRARRARPASRFPPGPRLGDLVVEAKGVRKAYGDKLLLDDLDFTLPRGGIVGVIGAERRRARRRSSA